MNSPVHPLLDGRRFYLCTPDRPDLADFVAACIDGGVDVVQLRDKSLDDRALLERAAIALDVCRKHGVPFVLNDRPELALICDADGVHVGQDDMPPAVARRILGGRAIIGLSTHSPTELDSSVSEPVDYISVGPVVPTPTKPGRPGTGDGYVAEAAAKSEHPFFVTGGVSDESVPGLAALGATRFVVVRYLTEAADPGNAARRLRTAIELCGDPV